MSSRIAACLALFRTAVCVYRAVTQSLTADEAFTFNNFVGVSWHDLYFHYDANNHLLYSILAKLSMSVLGDSEFALRLPSLIGGFFLMLGVWRILEHVESRAVRWIAFLAIGLHPLIFDFSVAARGYGLALTFLVWAIAASMEKRYKTAGVMLGLGISANFTIAFPALGLLAASLLMGEGSWIRRLARTIGMGLLAAVPVVITCAGVIPILSRVYFYVGFANLHDSIFDLVHTSILASPRPGLFGTWDWAYTIGFRILPVILLFILIASVLAWSRGARETLIPGLTLAGAAVAMFAAHRFFSTNYPINRTGLSFMLLFGLVWALAAGNMRNGLVAGINLLVAAALLVQFATQFHTTYFQVWPYDRSMKEIARHIEQEIRGKPPASVSIGATWLHHPALEYYRVHDRMAGLKPVARRSPTEIAGHDYYVLNRQDDLFSMVHDRTVLFSDPFAGVVLVK